MPGRWTQTRRQWVGTCLGTAGTATIAGCLGDDEDEPTDDGGPSGEDWPMYGVDLQNTGYHPTATGPEGDDLTRRPIHELNGLTDYPVIVVDDVLYGYDGSANIYALDLETEELLWEWNETGAPAYHDGRIYGPTDGGTILARDVETGEIWESEEADIDTDGIYYTNPIPTDRGLFAASAHAVWELDTESGQANQRIETPFHGRGTTNWPAFYDDKLFFGRLAELQAVDVESGEVDWTFTTENEKGIRRSSPAVADGTLYTLSGERKLHAIDVDTGNELWTVDLHSNPEVSPAVSNGLVYLAESNHLIAVDIGNETLEWEDEAERGEYWGSPHDVVVTDDLCYGLFELSVRAYDPLSGDFLWSYEFDIEDRLLAPPIIHGGTIYASANDENLYAIQDA